MKDKLKYIMLKLAEISFNLYQKLDPNICYIDLIIVEPAQDSSIIKWTSAQTGGYSLSLSTIRAAVKQHIIIRSGYPIPPQQAIVFLLPTFDLFKSYGYLKTIKELVTEWHGQTLSPSGEVIIKYRTILRPPSEITNAIKNLSR